MQSIEYKIEISIKKQGKGKIYSAFNFFKFADNNSIHVALMKLTKSGLLIRLANGIYLYPKINKYVGVVYPSLDEIAKVIAKRDKARIVPTGVYALNVLGLSTQVPLNAVYLTDGSQRKVKIYDGHGILFKKTSPKNLSYNSDLIMLIVSALKEIGESNVTDEQYKILKEKVIQEEKKVVIRDISLAPDWIRSLILKMYE